MTEELLIAVRALTLEIQGLRRDLANVARPVVTQQQAADDWSITPATLKKIEAALAEDNRIISMRPAGGHPLYSRRAMSLVESQLLGMPSAERMTR